MLGTWRLEISVGSSMRYGCTFQCVSLVIEMGMTDLVIKAFVDSSTIGSDESEPANGQTFGRCSLDW